MSPCRHHRILLPADGRHLLAYQALPSGRTHPLRAPALEIDGARVDLAPAGLAPDGPADARPNGVVEESFRGPVAGRPDLELRLTLRQAADDPVVRFRWELHATRPVRLTRTAGRDDLAYLGADLAGLPQATEVRFSDFDARIHSYTLAEEAVPAGHFRHREAVMGPVLAAGDGTHHLLLAYEHGSPAHDPFLRYHLAPDHSVVLRAEKGNYWHGQEVAPGRPFRSLWLEIAAIDGGLDQFAAIYRDFVLRHLSENLASRRPDVFYNTWCHQERLKHRQGRPYLAEMDTPRMLAEIDAAHRMGVEVFVIDTGWYGRTGDWLPSPQRFPDGLRQVREALAARDMRLGLWFAPTTVAMSSDMLARHRDCVMTTGGRQPQPWEVWETEPSIGCCLVSRYADAFADELARLHRELGVSYFKWDAIDQYGCDDPGHGHGDAGCSARERADCYAFQQPLALAGVVERLRARVPDAVCDFDITENGRCVGLAFLAASKYFLVNNGPYYHDYDIPAGADSWSNIFVRPGPARGWICREPLALDRWLPSTCFLVHHLPDDPADCQLIAVGSLILGHGGIWGDLPAVSPGGVALIGGIIARFRRVRDAITAAAPVRRGAIGASPEVHEKIAADGRGAVVLFANRAGTWRYRTAARVDPRAWAGPGVTVTMADDGTALVEVVTTRASAGIALFGAGD